MLRFIVKVQLALIFCSILSAKDFRGAEYRTIQTYTYGRFETRMQSAPHTGVISSLFTFHDFGSAGAANWNEIDIEFLGRYTDQVQFNTITENISGHEHEVDLDYDPATEFHDYAFEWTPEYVAWFIDGDEIYRQTGTHIAELHRASKIMMNIWPSTNAAWAGPFYDAWLPIYAFYDRVSYYAYVPGTGNTGTDNNFILLWDDNFDTWDTNRWQKASHTFDSNNCDFIPENAVLQDGYLILCLTQPENTGYNGPALGNDVGYGQTPVEFELSKAYPNPFNGSINLEFRAPTQGLLKIDVIDLNGQIQVSKTMQTAQDEAIAIQWDGNDQAGNALSSGVYIVRVQHPDGILSRKVLMLK